ncbi:MAG: tRNA pseudouridine(55) synthase TruB, partial [Patescibacteria group bacterium]
KRFPVVHTGTLDNSATGRLVLLLVTYTKKAPALTKLDKTYEVTIRLGQTSTTGDDEGEKRDVSDKQPSLDVIEHTLAQFVGDHMQTPPIYSAIKVNGQRAYKLARAGKTPVLEPRLTHIESIVPGTYEYPILTFTAHVSSGTYIRSLAEDIGKALETGAYMSELRRTKVGTFSIIDAAQIEDVSPAFIRSRIIALVP